MACAKVNQAKSLLRTVLADLLPRALVLELADACGNRPAIEADYLGSGDGALSVEQADSFAGSQALGAGVLCLVADKGYLAGLSG